MGLEHGREDDAMEDDVVLSDEVYHLGLLVFPIFFPLRRELLGRRDIAYRCVEPYVENLSLGPFDRYGNAPVEVAAHGAGLESPVEPALALAVDVGLPLLVSVEYPVAQKRLVSVERQVPVFGLAQYRLGTRNGTAGVDEVGGVERAAALFALVAVGSFAAALGTGSRDVAVGEEDTGLLVVILHGGLFREFALVVEVEEEIRCRFGMYGRGGARIDVERDAETLERLLDYLMVFVHYVLWGDAFAAGLDGDGNAVFVGTAHPYHVAPPFAEVADVNVRRHINPCEVSDVYGAVRIGQGRCDQIALVFFHFAFLRHCIATKLSFIFD